MHLNNDYDNKISPMNDIGFRYGKKVNKKFAFKLTGGYMKADDWNANDYRNKRNLNDNLSNRWTDASYDGVNVYGDEISINMEDIEDQIAVGFAENLGYVEGTSEYEQSIDMIKGIIPNQDLTRTGFKEKDLVSYNAENIKLGTSLHYRINSSLETVFQLNYANGTRVYSAQNRFSLNDFSISNYKAEIKSDNFLFRVSGVNENSGKTYDAGTLALQINEAWKPSELWYQDYFTGFLTGKLAYAMNDDEANVYARQVADNINEFGNVLDN